MNKISIRRVAGVIMAVLMLAVNVTAVAESYPIEPNILASLDLSASEWYKDEEHRALFVVAAMTDIAGYGNEEVNAILNESRSEGAIYVAKDGVILSLYCFGSEDMVLAGFLPIMNVMSATVVEGTLGLLAPALMEDLKADGRIKTYYKVTASDIATALNALEEKFGE